MNANERRFPTNKDTIAWVLLLIFAFTAWSLTAPANIALALLIVLFLTEIPGHWGQLRREPAFLLLLGVLLMTSLLAVRAAWLLPDTAADQWQAVSAWSAPFLFIVPAWWLRREPAHIWPLLGAAFLGLIFGVLRKTDWTLTPDILHGMRYYFGFAALGLAFLASVALVGILLFRARITGLRLGGRPRPLIGWTLWGLGFAVLIAVLVVTQSRGAALLLAIAGILYGALQGRVRLHQTAGRRSERARALAASILAITLAGTLLWATKGRQLEDWQALTVGSQGVDLSYTGSVTIRMNLHLVGLAAFAQAPLLGFGPGTSTTEYLVPAALGPGQPLPPGECPGDLAPAQRGVGGHGPLRLGGGPDRRTPAAGPGARLRTPVER